MNQFMQTHEYKPDNESCLSLVLVPMEQDKSTSMIDTSQNVGEESKNTKQMEDTLDQEGDDYSLKSSYDAEVAYQHVPEETKVAKNIDKIIKTSTRAMINNTRKSTAKFAGLVNDIQNTLAKEDRSQDEAADP